MGIVDRVKEDFYQSIIREHVLLLCGVDVDALCACKALQALFKADDVGHTVIPVAGKEDVRVAYNEHADQVKSMVLINCGGCANLVELLQPEGSVQLYVIDSQRPLNLDNVYNQDQIHVVVREDDQLEVPEFDDIYSSDLEEDDYGDEYFSDEDSAPRSKRRREEDSYESRRKRHLWRRKREELLYKYYEFDYHETAASLVVYELACKLNRDCNELLWLAITGLTEQLIHEKIDRERYVTDREKLQHKVTIHNRSDEDAPPTAINSMKITFENELRLVLYRHWTLYESLCHSEYTVCRFKIWSIKGKKKLQEFLAFMGLPLAQSKQKFLSMDEKYREDLKEMISGSTQKFQLEDINYGSFVAKFGYRMLLCASDMVFASTALMESADKPFSESFLAALEALSRPDLQLDGIKQAVMQQTAIVDQVKHFIETRQVVCTGPFIYADVEEGTQYVKNFSKPMTLCKLARFLRESWSVINRKACDLPFIVSAPLDSETGICLVVGVPPHSEDTRRSEFSKAFEHAADKLQGHVSFNHFDGSVIQIRKEDRSRFFDALIDISAPA